MHEFILSYVSNIESSGGELQYDSNYNPSGDNECYSDVRSCNWILIFVVLQLNFI